MMLVAYLYEWYWSWVLTMVRMFHERCVTPQKSCTWSLSQGWKFPLLCHSLSVAAWRKKEIKKTFEQLFILYTSILQWTVYPIYQYITINCLSYIPVYYNELHYSFIWYLKLSLILSVKTSLPTSDWNYTKIFVKFVFF
jgi:hypothetical protein